MARVTVEDCVLKVPNRFELVVLAAQRARHITAGSPLLVDRDNDKNPVVSLREIADTDLDLDMLKSSVVTGFRQHLPSDDLEEDEISDLFEQETRALQASAFSNEMDDMNTDDAFVDDADDDEGTDDDEGAESGSADTGLSGDGDDADDVV